ncbi:hypothetical protein DM01DRAFT_1181246 [Hesseltinella vesiculosa]|uniref:Dpy-30-domain-containing protein n=2 Tax=Hesseltinella vesiculosa TaxID=101127 RepID=A0A1X2G595_9FUNG|nr:hypothetical protein DM01DRAFT_1181246 [Hesseltinella vesiculosa]
MESASKPIAIEPTKSLEKTENDLPSLLTENSTTVTNSHVASIAPRAYLDDSVVPVLLEGMKLLVIERPTDPLEFLGKYLLERSQKTIKKRVAKIDGQ